MTIMMVSELAGAGPEVLDGLSALGVFDKMNSAPGLAQLTESSGDPAPRRPPGRL
jgi:hypothetical protein